ncbi:TIGR01212 family radical SAM protein [bacterium]
MSERYKKYSTYLKDRFSQRVHRISIDAGFSCPNRDGVISTGGCIYCDNKSFSYNSNHEPLSIEQQIINGIQTAGKRFNAKKYILYFQAYTNTYADIKVLKEKYDVIKKFKDIVGLSIATRPDCIDDAKLDLIKSYTNEYDVWIEYGLQSIHDETLKKINRGHKYKDFLDALEKTRSRGIKVCVHVIIGLAGETREMILETAKQMGALKIDGIKIHPLYIVKTTPLAQSFEKKLYETMDLEDYVDILAEFLTYLDKETVVQRLSAYCSKEILTAPLWAGEHHVVEPLLEYILKAKNIRQGLIKI